MIAMAAAAAIASALIPSKITPLFHHAPASRKFPTKPKLNLNLLVYNKLLGIPPTASRSKSQLLKQNRPLSQILHSKPNVKVILPGVSPLIDRYWAVIDKLLDLREKFGNLFVWCTTLAVMLSVLTVHVDDANAFVVTPARKLQTDELATVRLFQENTPSVVYITNLAVRQDAFTLDVLEVPQGSGSGFIWDQKGNVVTNYHVIRGASDLRSLKPHFLLTFGHGIGFYECWVWKCWNSSRIELGAGSFNPEALDQTFFLQLGYALSLQVT
eukprot:Gb_28169 [translate_table: standard]